MFAIGHYRHCETSVIGCNPEMDLTSELFSLGLLSVEGDEVGGNTFEPVFLELCYV
jgi:hypothetical protein